MEIIIYVISPGKWNYLVDQFIQLKQKENQLERTVLSSQQNKLVLFRWLRKAWNDVCKWDLHSMCIFQTWFLVSSC